MPNEAFEAAIFLVHFLGEYNGGYAHMAEHLNQNRFAFTAFDMCGHGLSGGKRGQLLYADGLSQIVLSDITRFTGLCFDYE